MPAKYDNLPVFKQCYDALFQAIEWSAKMQKDFRYGIADDLKRKLIQVEVCIYRANCAKNETKIQHIVEALELMVEIKLYSRVLHDARQISTKQFAIACERYVEIEKNLENWKKYNENLHKES